MDTEWIDEPDRLKTLDLCIFGISKNLEGTLGRGRSNEHVCSAPLECTTRRTVSKLKLKTNSNAPCDSDLAKLLPSTITSNPELVILQAANSVGRGMHAGFFDWSTSTLIIKGRMSGTTNAGIHRASPFQGCERCIAPGILIGRLTAKIKLARNAPARLRPLDKAEIVAVYRLEVSRGGGVKGTLEGAITVRCL